MSSVGSEYKKCTKCKEIKSIAEFTIDRYKKDGLTSSCKDCQSQSKKTSRTPERAFSSHIKYRFKITLEQYKNKLRQQDFCCTICGKVFTNDARIDHDHTCCDEVVTCGECVRDIICQRCNALVGYVEKTPDLVKEVFDYIERHKRCHP